MHLPGKFRTVAFSLSFLWIVAGCSTNAPVPIAVAGRSGAIYGGQQPITGATIQLYAVGTSGDGLAATPLLNKSVLSASDGTFNITGAYTCPSASALVYITGTGGIPSPGITNPQSALMAAIGPCGSLTASSFLNINELTTVAAVYALAPFMSSYSAIGSTSADAAALASAFTSAGYFVNVATGQSPGTNLPVNTSVPVAQLNTIADLVAACINSAGGVSGGNSICGSFFALTLPSGAVPPTDTIGALLNLANNPTLNTAALYNLIPSGSPFQPTQPIIPPDFSLRLVVSSPFVVSPSALTFASAVIGFTQPTQTVTVTNGTSASVNISSAAISGVNASDFDFAPQPGSPCTITVLANSTCAYQVSFTPSAAGSRAAYLILGNTSANPSIAIGLAGTGLAGSAGPATLTPSSLVFTQPGVPQTLTLTNNGSGTLTLNAINLSSPAYTQTNNCGSSLAATTSCNINVSAPSSLSGTDNPTTVPPSTLTVVDDAAAGPQTANLSFSGSSSTEFPPLVDFGHWAIGTTGSEFLQIGSTGISGSFSFTIAGTNATDFSFAPGSSVLTSSCSYNYRSSSSCDFSIYFKPTAQITSNAYVTIAGVGQFSLTGTGDRAGVDFGLYQTPYSPAVTGAYYTAPITALNLSSTSIGTPASVAFAIQNTGIVSPLALNTAVISGPNASEFTVTAPSCATGCTPSVTFTPTIAGTATATLTYTDTTNAVTRTLALTGTAGVPAPVLTAPTMLFFSNVPLGTTSASQTITVNAYQNHPIQASIVSTYSGGPQPFIFTSPTFCSSTPCTLSIAYAPLTSADDGANVYVVAEDTVGLSSGNIQAYGQVAPLAYVSFNPTSLTFPSQALKTVSTPQTVTFTNTGTTSLALTFSIPAKDFTLVNNCPTPLAINASCTVAVTFAPVSGTGTLSSNLVINGSNVTRYVTLTGTSF